MHHAVLPGVEAGDGYGSPGRGGRITYWLIYGWAALRLLDIAFREQFGTAFHFDRFAGVFWLEMISIVGGG